MNTVLPPELPYVWAGIVAYGIATFTALRRAGAGTARTRHGMTMREWWVLGALTFGIVLLAGGLATRWVRIGHGPFLSLFEVLGSSLVSLGMLYAIAYMRMAVVRTTASVVLPLLTMMAFWLLFTSTADTHLPPTYEMSVLWFHVVFGKLFLGCALIATGIAGVVLGWNCSPRSARLFGPSSQAVLDALAWQFMRIALFFESLMLISGAVWAQDAWGRYWAWDPLETWAFITWLTLAAAMHARISFRVPPQVGAMLIFAVFTLAFLTFFGIPFVSTAPHKGAV